VPVTRSGIQWTELYLPGAIYRESWVDGSQTSERFAEVDWDDSSLFVFDMVGYTTRGAQWLKRVTPEPHPYFDKMFCVECHSINAYGNHINTGPNTSIKLDKIQYRLVYKPLEYVVAEDVTVIGSVEHELERYIIRKKKWAFVNQQMPVSTSAPGNVKPPILVFNGAHAGTTVPTNPARPQATIQLEYTWKRVPRLAVPVDTITAGAFTINNDLFDKTYHTGTLAFLGADQRDYYDAAGDFVCDLVYLFACKPEGWNFYPNVDWKPEAIIVQSTGLGPFIESDFDKLFVPA
jgi:hypothetical protein